MAREAAAVCGAQMSEGEAGMEGWRFVAALAGCSVGDVVPFRAHQQVPAPVAEKLVSAIERVRRGEPPAYVVGRVPFHQVEVAVDRRALIPRPETELLVDLVVGWCRTMGGRLTLLDAGTGTGCIALALAQALPGATVFAVDISPGALRLAASNVAGAAGRVHLVRGSWLSWTRGRFHVIVANPPYVGRDEWHQLPSAVRDWEPVEALDGGPQGRDHLAALISCAQDHLVEGGLLAVELGPRHASWAAEFAKDHGLVSCQVVADYSGRPRVLLAWRGASCSA